MDRPTDVVLWGHGSIYGRLRERLRIWEKRGDIRILAITASEPPAADSIDGIPVIHPRELEQLRYDYLFMLVKERYSEAMTTALNTQGLSVDKVVKYWTLELPQFSFEEYDALRRRRVSIFSNSCWGGFVSRSLSLEHRSPFKNLYLDDEGYLKLLGNARYYCTQVDPAFSRWKTGGDEGQERFPVLALDDVEVYCNHHTDPDAAIYDWLRRREKINWDDVFVEMSTRNPEIERRFDQLEMFPNRVCFVPFAANRPASVTIRPIEGENWLDTVHRAVDYKMNRFYFPLAEFIAGKKQNVQARVKEEPMVKVSVVIPVYNVEKWLPACLDSVLGQTLHEIEVICIDDCSPDGCPAILDDYAARDDRMRVFHLPENHRQGYGRNLGLREARGRYIYFLDSDDMILPEALEELYEIAERDGLDSVFFDARSIYENEALAREHANEVDLRRGCYPEGVVPGEPLYRAFVRQIEWTCYVQRQFWSLDYLRERKIVFPEWEHEDELFAFRGILQALRCRYVRKAYFIHRFRPDSVMTRPPSVRDFCGYFATFCHMEQFLREQRISLGQDISAVMYFYRWCQSHYDELDREMIEMSLPTEVLDRYFFFRLVREADNKAKPLPLSEYKEKLLRGYEHIYVYGAGSVAKRAFNELSDHGMVVDGFVVSRAEGSPRAFCGRPVTELSRLETDRENTVILTAMIREYEEEVRGALQEAGWKYLSFLH